ncbi:hypothetical protein [Bernardetia sp.]|uniref:hypothetical protein n=1 Tax=Bernardetia sp. TaxID=1937974 RepID=UPI0025BE2FF5|nr:hypothetical protein [Bernardetia sp.]
MSSCNNDDDDDDNETETPTLYDRVGGTTMVTDPVSGGQIQQGRLTLRAVVDSAIFVIAADPELQPYFAVLLAEVGNNDLSGFSALSNSLTDFFVVATSENTVGNYTGLDMVSAHDPAQNPRMALKADNAAMDAFIADVGVSLGKNGVTDQELINDLVALLETLRDPIVQR